MSKVEHILLNGTQLILNPVYKSTGFDKINDDLLRHLVLSRICQLKISIDNRASHDSTGRVFRVSKGVLASRPMFHFTKKTH